MKKNHSCCTCIEERVNVQSGFSVSIWKGEEKLLDFFFDYEWIRWVLLDTSFIYDTWYWCRWRRQRRRQQRWFSYSIQDQEKGVQLCLFVWEGWRSEEYSQLRMFWNEDDRENWLLLSFIRLNLSDVLVVCMILIFDMNSILWGFRSF